MFVNFLDWTGWEAIGVIVSIIIGIITIWMTAKLLPKQNTQNLDESVQSAPVIDAVDEQTHSPSVQKKIVVIVSIIIISIITIWITAKLQSKQSTQNLDEPVQSAPVIDVVDGQAYNPSKHKKIVALVVYRYAVNGKKILGFTSKQKAQQYEQDYLNDRQKAKDDFTYFYEHVSFDLHKLGNRLPVRIGTSVSYVGSLWNDEISSVNVHPQSKVRVYEDSNYRGPHVTFVNNDKSRSHWFIDLASYNFLGGVDWNDSISSIKTW